MMAVVSILVAIFGLNYEGPSYYMCLHTRCCFCAESVIVDIDTVRMLRERKMHCYSEFLHIMKHLKTNFLSSTFVGFFLITLTYC